MSEVATPRKRKSRAKNAQPGQVAAPKMRTVHEATRMPDAAVREQEKVVTQHDLLDETKYRLVRVQDEIGGVETNFRDVAWYESQGYQVASTDKRLTGHKAYTLMAITHEEYNRRENQRLARANSGTISEDDKDAYARGLASGVAVRESQGYNMAAVGAALPSVSEIDRREAQAEFNAMSLSGTSIGQIAREVAAEAD